MSTPLIDVIKFVVIPVAVALRIVSRSPRLAAVVLLCFSCSSLGSGVQVTRNPRDLAQCRDLGRVSTQEGLRDLKRRAVALGANTVFVVAESVSIRGGASETVGMAYRCP